MWLSGGVQWVICISPSRHSHPDPAALCTWWNGSQSCCLDNRSLDYRLWEWRERERETKRKGVIVRICGHLATSCWFFFFFFKFWPTDKELFQAWDNASGCKSVGGLKSSTSDLNRPSVRRLVFTRSLCNFHLALKISAETILFQFIVYERLNSHLNYS